MTTLHIHAPKLDYCAVRKIHCSTCGKKTRMLTTLAGWYGPDWACMECGDRWNEEGRVERPFMPRWRQDSIDSARRTLSRWRRKYGNKHWRPGFREELA